MMPEKIDRLVFDLTSIADLLLDSYNLTLLLQDCSSQDPDPGLSKLQTLVRCLSGNLELIHNEFPHRLKDLQDALENAFIPLED